MTLPGIELRSSSPQSGIRLTEIFRPLQKARNLTKSLRQDPNPKPPEHKGEVQSPCGVIYNDVGQVKSHNYVPRTVVNKECVGWGRVLQSCTLVQKFGSGEVRGGGQE